MTYQDIIWTEIPGKVTPIKLGFSTPISNVLYWTGSIFGIGQQEQNSKPKHPQSMPLLPGKSAMWAVLWDRPRFLLELWHSWHDFKQITSLSAAAFCFTYEPMLLQMFVTFSKVWLLNSRELQCTPVSWAQGSGRCVSCPWQHGTTQTEKQASGQACMMTFLPQSSHSSLPIWYPFCSSSLDCSWTAIRKMAPH